MDNFSEREIIRIRKLVGENAQVVSISILPSNTCQLAHYFADWRRQWWS